MAPVTPSVASLIMRELFAGKKGVEVAGITGLSPMTVTNVKKAFIADAEVHGLAVAASNYGVAEQVESLIKTSKQVEEAGGFDSVKQGLRYGGVFDRAGFKPKDARRARARVLRRRRKTPS